MARKIKEFPKVGRGRDPKYENLEQYLDGESWVLVRGSKDEVAEGKADFDCKPESFRATIYRVAGEQNLSVKSAILTDEDTGRESLVVKATGPKKQRKPKAEPKAEAKAA